MAGTTAKGLGWAYQRRRALLAPPEGDPCPFCAAPMWPDQRLHVDHAVPRAAGGEDGPLRWAHGRCNEQAGAQIGNRLRTRQAGPKWASRWA